MKSRIVQTVPPGIEFISDWDEYTIPKGEHCIVDKGMTGCGYTEMVLTNEDPVVLCSPRKLLLENKTESHKKKGDKNLLYIDETIREDLEYHVYDHLQKCSELGVPPKFLITYDSTGRIVDVLKELDFFDEFVFVVDEFQSIFLDSYFKVGVEFDFIENLQNCKNVIYLSATPMLSKYLNQLEMFKGLDFYQIDWSESGISNIVYINRKRTNSLVSECIKIVKQYQNGYYPITTIGKEVYTSKEAVFYFNSVTEIIRVITKCGLTPQNTSIICSRTDNNKKKLRHIKFDFGKIPLEGETNPMFTFCTSAVYMGVDFYSDSANSYVFADPNISCLALDISLDLPQIMGRQRNKNNPFKNSLALFYKTKRKGELELTKENFDEYREEKKKNTQGLLNFYTKGTKKEKDLYVEKLKSDIQVSNYSKDFVSISEKTGEPVYNPLIDIADQRAWDVSQKDYQDAITVTKRLQGISNLEVNLGIYSSNDEQILKDFLDNEFYPCKIFDDRLKLYCEFRDKNKDNPVIMEGLLNRVTDQRFNQYYNYFGASGCRAVSFQEASLLRLLRDASKDNLLVKEIYSTFKEGDRYLSADIKEILRGIYQKLSLSKSPKASDIKEYFELSITNITTPEGVKKGFILKKRLQ